MDLNIDIPGVVTFSPGSNVIYYCGDGANASFFIPSVWMQSKEIDYVDSLHPYKIGDKDAYGMRIEFDSAVPNHEIIQIALK